MKKIPLNISTTKVGMIVYTENGGSGKYNIPVNSAFRVKYVGSQHVIADGLNEKVPLGEYVFDLSDLSNLKLFTIEFE